MSHIIASATNVIVAEIITAREQGLNYDYSNLPSTILIKDIFSNRFNN